MNFNSFFNLSYPFILPASGRRVKSACQQTGEKHLMQHYSFFNYLIHYATHRYKMAGKSGRFLKEYHLRHHYTDEKTAYGISNPVWDFILRTLPPFIYRDVKEGSK